MDESMRETPQTSAIERPEDRPRSSAWVGVLWLIVSIALVAAFPLYTLTMPRDSSPYSLHSPQVEIHDTAHVLDAEELTVVARSMLFSKPVRLVIYTTPDAHGNLDSATYSYASSSPEAASWISADAHDRWADGLMILALAPNDRLVGTYFGDDLVPSSRVQKRIQDAMKDDFREGEWTQGLKAGLAESTDELAEPDISLGAVVSMLGSLTGLAGLLVSVARATRAKNDLARARTHWEHVTQDRVRTMQAAFSIPSASNYALLIRVRADMYEARVRDVEQRWEELGTPGVIAFYSPDVQKKLRALYEETREMDSTDDAILTSAQLYTRTADWQNIWVNELGPVFEDLDDLEEVCDNDYTVASEENRQRVAFTRVWITETRQQLTQILPQMEANAMTSDQALETLDEISAEIRHRAEELMRGALQADDSDEAHERRELFDETCVTYDPAIVSGYSGTYTLHGVTHSYRPEVTIRLHARTPGLDRLRLTQETSFGQMAYGSVPVYMPLLWINNSYMNVTDFSSTGGGFSDGANYGTSGFSGAGSSSSF